MGGYAPCSSSAEGKDYGLPFGLATGVLKFLLTAWSSFYLDGFNRAAEIWNRPAAYVPHSQGPSLPWLCLCDGSPICRLTPYYF